MLGWTSRQAETRTQYPIFLFSEPSPLLFSKVCYRFRLFECFRHSVIFTKLLRLFTKLLCLYAKFCWTYIFHEVSPILWIIFYPTFHKPVWKLFANIKFQFFWVLKLCCNRIFCFCRTNWLCLSIVFISLSKMAFTAFALSISDSICNWILHFTNSTKMSVQWTNWNVFSQAQPFP
jgi:hypothetical protein